MVYLSDALNEIERMGKNLMMPSEISALMGWDEMEFQDDINTLGNPARVAYNKGLATTARDIRAGIIDAANAGSPYSIAECHRLILRALSEIQ